MIIERAKKFKEFLGREAWYALLASAGVGLMVFAVESSFVYVLQGFLYSMKILPEEKLMLPDWYPRSLLANVAILSTFGILRASAIGFKVFFALCTQEFFLFRARSRVIDFGLNFATHTSTPEVVGYLSDHLTRVARLVCVVSLIMVSGTMVILFFVLGLYMAPWEMLIGVLALSILLPFSSRYNNRAKQAGTMVSRRWEQIMKHVIEGLRHNVFLRVHGLVPQSVQNAISYLKSYEGEQKFVHGIRAVKVSLPGAVAILFLSFITYLSIHYFGTSGVPLLAFVYIFMRFSVSLGELASNISAFKGDQSALVDVYQWFQKIKNIQDQAEQPHSAIPAHEKAVSSSDLKSMNETGIHIEFDHVDFAYDQAHPVLKNVSFQLRKGQCLVVRGPSGSGKSTMLSLLFGFYQPQRGQVKINGYTPSAIKNDFAPYMAYVGPDPFLIIGTVKENLLYGHSTASQIDEKQMVDALKQVDIEDTVSKLPQGLETVIDEFAKLSTGQKQRIALARALLRRPQLLLLDEATANLDTSTEAKIVKTLEQIKHNVTMIVITHKNTFESIATQKIELQAEKQHESEPRHSL